MCDTEQGTVLLSFPRDDREAIGVLESAASSLSVESLRERLERHEVTVDSPTDYYRIHVEAGAEDATITELYLRYAEAMALARRPLPGRWGMGHGGEPFPHFRATRNVTLRVESGAGYQPPVAPNLFTVNASQHQTYLNQIGATSPPVVSTEGVHVALLDSGLGEPTRSILSGSLIEHDFTVADGQNPLTADDDSGHGSLVAYLVNEVAPDCSYTIVRVAQGGGGSEWALLLGLFSALDNTSKLGPCRVVNVSLSTSVGAVACDSCGTSSQSTRARTFERAVQELTQAADPPVVVAAAGNAGVPLLSFPARFQAVVAVASVDAAGAMSGFSNTGTDAWPPQPHPNLIAAPGGEAPARATAAQVSEYVAKSSKGVLLHGTSFSAAYVSGVVARLWAELGQSGPTDAAAVVAELKQRADRALPWGNGVVQV